MGTTNNTNVTNCDARILQLALRMVTNLVSLCVIANAVKQIADSTQLIQGKNVRKAISLDCFVPRNDAKRVVGLLDKREAGLWTP